MEFQALHRLKMKVLVTNRRALTWICMIPPEPGTPVNGILLQVLFTIVTMAFVLCVLAASVVFFLNNIAIDYALSLFVLLQICAFMSAAYMALSGFALRQQMHGVFETLQAIYDASK